MSSAAASTTVAKKTTPRNIPEAKFVDDVCAYMKTRSVEEELRSLDELHQKYKFMERSLHTKKLQLEGKVPDLRNNRDILGRLQSKLESGDDMKTHFELADNIYAEAVVPPAETVLLWLGANVMLEYPLDEAIRLVEKNLDGTTRTVTELDDDLAFLREQITTTEVNIARIHNWDVRKKREQKTSSNE